jgi:hypothetical protein
MLALSCGVLRACRQPLRWAAACCATRLGTTNRNVRQLSARPPALLARFVHGRDSLLFAHNGLWHADLAEVVDRRRAADGTSSYYIHYHDSARPGTAPVSETALGGRRLLWRFARLQRRPCSQAEVPSCTPGAPVSGVVGPGRRSVMTRAPAQWTSAWTSGGRRATWWRCRAPRWRTWPRPARLCCRPSLARACPLRARGRVARCAGWLHAVLCLSGAHGPSGVGLVPAWSRSAGVCAPPWVSRVLLSCARHTAQHVVSSCPWTPWTLA